jgi:hypothetical protein
LNNRLNDQVNRNAIVPGAIRLQVKKFKNIYAEEYDEKNRDGADSFEMSNAMGVMDRSELNDLDLIPGHDNSPVKRVVQPTKEEKLADYARSKRQVEMRIRQGMTDDVEGHYDDNT